MKSLETVDGECYDFDPARDAVVTRCVHAQIVRVQTPPTHLAVGGV